MKKKIIFIGALALFTGALAACDNNNNNNTTNNSNISNTTNTDSLNEQIQKLEEENNRIKAQNEALTKENGELKTENDDLTKANSNLNTENSTLKTEYENYKSLSESLEDKIDNLKEENAQIKNIKKQYLKNNNLFEISYIDYLGNATTKYNKVSDFENVTAALNDLNVGAVITPSQYGAYIDSANNAIKDPNWAIMIYENYESTATGIDGLTIDSGDVFEIKSECWNTFLSGYGAFDKYDVLVDKVLYNYFNNRFKNTLSSTKTFSNSSYWENLVLYKLINAKSSWGGSLYDSELFNTTLLNDELVNELNSYDLNNLKGTDFFKYYYADRLINDDFTDFKLKFDEYVKTFKTYGEWGEYTIPFVASSAKTLGLIDSLSDYVKNSTYIPDASQWGPDGISWLLTGKSSYKTLTDDDFKLLSFDLLDNSLSKDVSLSTMILPYAAANKNVRDFKNENGIDLIQFLCDNYFNLDEMKFNTELQASDYSSNQIYAALAAYKIQRDTKEACNLFE